MGRLGDPLVSSRYAYLFPGQGSQFSGMGRDLADAFDEAREVFESADRALGHPISELCFAGSAADLALTENTQPAILTVSVAALRALEKHGLRPTCAAGHSLGEYSAHVAAGTISFADAVTTVRSRGRFMQRAVPVGQGAMSAILGLGADDVAEICSESAGDEIVSAANLNGPAQVVIAGHAAAVERAGTAAREAGARKVVSLSVSAPFHCALMSPAAEELLPVLEGIEFRDPSFPVFTNADAAPVRDGARARDALFRQVVSAVRWHETVEAMLESGVDTFVEVGPGKVLAGLVRGIRRSARVLPAGNADQIAAAAAELAD